MTFSKQDALIVPTDGDERVLFDWVHSLSVAAVVPSIPPPAELAARFDLVAVEATSAFWDERGRGSLTAALAEMFDGLALLGGAVLIAVLRDGTGFEYVVGVDRKAGGSAAVGVAAALPGARVRSLEGPETARRRAAVLNTSFAERCRVGILGSPRGLRSPPHTPLVERLAATEVDSWSLVLLAEPVPQELLVDRVHALRSLGRNLSSRLSSSVRTSRLETHEIRDPGLAALVELVDREERRTLEGVAKGAFLAECWLGADETRALRSLAAVTATVLAASGSQPRPLRLVEASEDGAPGASLMLGNELASIVQPPLNDVPGFPVTAWARFDEAPESVGGGGRTVQLGATPAGVRLDYPLHALTAHALITGATGSGKSSFVFDVLTQLRAADPPVPFLVIEPVKAEYARVPIPGLGVWELGAPADRTRFRLNPLEVPNGVLVQTHIDLLMALLRSTLSLFPPLPYILEMGLRRAYTERGWDLAASRNPKLERDPEHPAYPSLTDLIECSTALVDDLGYSGEVRDNVHAALQARLGSLTVGAKGALLDTEENFDIQRLLSSPWVVNLDRIGNDDEKAFLIGLLLIRLLEARQRQFSRTLVHVTVLEEAHRILKRQKQAESVDGGDSQFASETFGNLLAEVRAAGEGIVVVDQSPRKLAEDALANTGLKIAFRTPFGEDKDVLAAALNLSDPQKDAMTGLPTHRAAVFWQGMDRPVLADAAHAFGDESVGVDRDSVTAAAEWGLDPIALRIARTLVAARHEERAAIRAALERRLGDVLESDARPEDVRRAADSHVRKVVHQIGRRRQWPLRVRKEVVDFLEENDRGNDDPRALLLDGRLPLAACSAVCGDGGCLLGEVGARAGRLLVRRGLAPRLDLLASDVLREETEAVVAEELGTSFAPSLLDTAVGCAIVHALDGTTDPARAALVVARGRRQG